MGAHEISNVMDPVLPNDLGQKEHTNTTTSSIPSHGTSNRNAKLLSTFDSLYDDMGFNHNGANVLRYKVNTSHQTKPQANSTEFEFIKPNTETKRNKETLAIKELTKRCIRLQLELETQRKANKNVESLESALQVANAKNEQLKFDHERDMQTMAETYSQDMQKLTLEVEMLKMLNSCSSENSVPVKPQAEQSAVIPDVINQLKQSLAKAQEKHKTKTEELQQLHESNIARHQEKWRKTYDWQLENKQKAFENMLEEISQQKDTEIKKLQLKLQEHVDNAKQSDERLHTLNQTIKNLQDNLTLKETQLNSIRSLYAKKIAAMQREYMLKLEKIATDMNQRSFVDGENRRQIRDGASNH